ncbi:hypothetical protein N7489_002958 [Penicillium chrysogenum]|uniref:Uncharacterized protein n=1 Tax=Penicillium chrysogenum TaxID=5076 RepID=A0ABQ8W762_PENCH|nr:uncharacterized protein N7489_002958 [Penicillium chrysogenum]KAJ5252548.1 hypothetical protein N7489_002958 [Penicillium chrysogenum]KAJ5259787.1 hypothetical protein N7505_009168 [Penicillium chrysogenum]KAJ6142347.1 hypothetical protein N7497_011446 [Penicillium chrysogenum]
MRLQLPEDERYWFERISHYTTTGSLSHLNYFAQSSPKQKRPSTVLVAYLTQFGLFLSHRTMWLLSNCPNTDLGSGRGCSS